MNAFWKLMRRWTWPVLKVAVVATVAAGVFYWVKLAPVSVVAHRVQRGPIVAEVMGTGTLEARVEATISPKISSRVQEILVDQGDSVTAGEVLVRLDEDELQQQVAIARANVEAAEAAIRRLGTDKARATAVYDQARKSNTRVQTLLRKKAVSEGEADRATEALAVAVTGISRAEAAISEGQKEQVAAEKTLEYHRARLADTQILAPFAGLIVKRSREPGDVVVPGSSILTLISLDELWIRAWVDETSMAKLQAGQTARVVFRSEPERSYPGEVVRLGKEADRETREFIVDVRVLELAKNWAVGQRAEVFIEVARKDDVVLLPAELILTREAQRGVFVDEQEHAVWHPINTGFRSREFVEVLDGLQPEDVVVGPKNGRAKLSSGRRITLP